jgi:hypothetical protein
MDPPMFRCFSFASKRLAGARPRIFLFFSSRFWYNILSKEGELKVHNVVIETELHVLTPNEPGILGRVLGTLANAGVNLRALNAYARENEGHFLILTSNNKKAETALRSLGYKVKTNKVMTVEISDRIGAGAEIGALLGNAVIDIDYCYGSSAGKGNAILIFRTNNNKKAYETLR